MRKKRQVSFLFSLVEIRRRKFRWGGKPQENVKNPNGFYKSKVVLMTLECTFSF